MQSPQSKALLLKTSRFWHDYPTCRGRVSLEINDIITFPCTPPPSIPSSDAKSLHKSQDEAELPANEGKISQFSLFKISWHSRESVCVCVDLWALMQVCVCMCVIYFGLSHQTTHKWWGVNNAYSSGMTHLRQSLNPNVCNHDCLRWIKRPASPATRPAFSCYLAESLIKQYVSLAALLWICYFHYLSCYLTV